jgi:hypothetical protein
VGEDGGRRTASGGRSPVIPTEGGVAAEVEGSAQPSFDRRRRRRALLRSGLSFPSRLKPRLGPFDCAPFRRFAQGTAGEPALVIVVRRTLSDPSTRRSAS